jgi:hypothetical protein
MVFAHCQSGAKGLSGGAGAEPPARRERACERTPLAGEVRAERALLIACRPEVCLAETFGEEERADAESGWDWAGVS